MKLKLYHTLHKNQLNMDWRLKHKTWNYKTFGRKYREILHDTGLSNF